MLFKRRAIELRQKRRFFVWVAGSAIIIFAVLGFWHCYRQHRVPTHWDYIRMENFYLKECIMGGIMEMDIDFRERTILYDGLYVRDIQRTFTNEEKKELIALLEEYKVLAWEDGCCYRDKGGGSHAKRTGMSLFGDRYYMGIGIDELSHKNFYDCDIIYRAANTDYRLSYSNYNYYPEGYDDLLNGLWDFVFAHDIPDERDQLNQKAENALKYPYMGEEKTGKPDYNKIWYFSINEFFGGREGPGATWTYSHSQRDYKRKEDYMGYRTWNSLGFDLEGINYVDGQGAVQKYRDKDHWLENKWDECKGILHGKSYLSEEGKQRLAEILKKYDVASWKEADYYQKQPEPAHIQGGEFFNLIPGKHESNVSELELQVRSAFESFIYLYDSDGKRLRLHYDNAGLPENYNEFRKELWDFTMVYMDDYVDYFKYGEDDWRERLDQWGRHYLAILQERETIEP